MNLHHALLLSKASGWRNHAFFHVHGAKKEDNCAPRGKHASAPHRPALPLPAIRLASASHARSSFRPPLARSMHASPNSARGSATEPWCAAAAAKRPICLLPKCGVSRHQHVCRCGNADCIKERITHDLRSHDPPFRRSLASKSMRRESNLTTALRFFLRSSFVHVLAPRDGSVVALILASHRAACARRPSDPTVFLLIMMLTACHVQASDGPRVRRMVGS